MSNLKFKDHKRNTTWNGAKITITNNDGTPKNLTGYKAKSNFKLNANSLIEFGFDTEDGTMTIPVGTDGIIFMLKRLMNVPANQYYSDLELISPEGDVINSDDKYSILITHEFS